MGPMSNGTAPSRCSNLPARHAAMLKPKWSPLRAQAGRSQRSVLPATPAMLFDGGPPWKLQRRLRLITPGQRCLVRRIAFIVVVSWLPLMVLGGENFAADFGAHARYLVAAPVLILAESLCALRLGALAQYFPDSGLVADEERPRFDAVVSSTLRLRDAPLAELMVIVAAYSLVALLMYAVPERALAAWHSTAGGALTWAGWWNVLVSLPLVIVLLLGWFWRFVLWVRFLWYVSRLNLRLIAAHPDRSGGLYFVSQSVRVFAVLAFVISVLTAGSIANEVAHHAVSPLAFKYVLGALVLINLILFTAPLFVFTGALLATRARGLFIYGALALTLGREFERVWTDQRRPVDERALETPAFSATTDLYQVVANVYQMRFVPLDWQSVAVLIVAMLLPAVPVVLSTVPLNQVMSRLATLIL